LPYEYELKQNLQDLTSGKIKELPSYSQQIINTYLKENNMTSTDVIELAIENHKEYKNMLMEELGVPTNTKNE